jgi:hypothetical protein
MIPYEEDGGEDEYVANVLSAKIIEKIGQISELSRELKLLQLLQKREMERQELDGQ